MEIITQIRHDIVKMLFDVSDVQSLLSIREQLEATLATRKKWELKQQESSLMLKLNTEYVLAVEDWQRFVMLKDKKETNAISDQEQLELNQLIQEEEQLRLKRIEVLGELSKLKKVPLMELVKTLNIQPMRHG